MLQTIVGSFVGCFAALVVIAETSGIANKVIRYLAAFVVGVLAAVLLGVLLSWIASAFSQLH